MKFFNIGYERELTECLNRQKENIRKAVVELMELKNAGFSKSKNLLERLLDINVKGGESLGVEKMVNFVTNFLIAGRDTTSSTMT